jgi:hypothetical protein
MRERSRENLKKETEENAVSLWRTRSDGRRVEDTFAQKIRMEWKFKLKSSLR